MVTQHLWTTPFLTCFAKSSGLSLVFKYTANTCLKTSQCALQETNLLMTSPLQTSVAVGDIQEIRQNALLRQRELHVSLVYNPLGWPLPGCS